MNNFSIAAAQSSSLKGNIPENILIHQKYIEAASDHNVDVIVFPELSLTGYEPAVAQENAILSDDNILNPLLNLAQDKNITIIAGCPIRSEFLKPYIGVFIVQPSQEITVYKKRYLHKGEDLHFIPSQDNVVYKCKGETIGIAICADIDNPKHPADLKKLGVTVYAAGVMISPTGINDAYKKMPAYAVEHQMLTVMANYAAETGGFATPGKSAVWNEKGNCIAKAEGIEQALIIARKENNDWTGEKIIVS